jgi:hemerythrin-like domain-containing protein/nucleotide-binding universal stress UspA family protein
MFNHILAPVDDSLFSAFSIEKIVSYAKETGARLTFFHAQPDLGTSSDGAVLRTLTPEQFRKVAAGKARGILSKAAAAAHAENINCEIVSIISDHPAIEIIRAATDLQCDLIYMFSHGRKGLSRYINPSVTLDVLSQAKVAVLVGQIEGNKELTYKESAITVIKDEHRSLAAILELVNSTANKNDFEVGDDDLNLIFASLVYIKTFPERLHHPKEEQYLFDLLLKRTDKCTEVIRDLELQHRNGAILLEDLWGLAQRVKSHEVGALEKFKNSLDQFTKGHWHHMSTEERVLMPYAEMYLTESDWQTISTAFLENTNPQSWVKDSETFDRVFERIINMPA